MRACQHRQSRQPPPTLTKHSTPKVAGNSPLPISCGKIISLKFRHFQHMIEHSIIELHAKLQGAHRTTVPHSATRCAVLIGGDHRLRHRLFGTSAPQAAPLPRARMHKTAPASSLLREGTRPGQGQGVMFPGRATGSVEAANPAREGQAPSGSGDCESDQAEQPEGGVHRGKVAGLVNKREDQPGDRTSYASQA